MYKRQAEGIGVARSDVTQGIDCAAPDPGRRTGDQFTESPRRCLRDQGLDVGQQADEASDDPLQIGMRTSCLLYTSRCV